MTGSGQLDEFCAQHGIRLLVVFGSTVHRDAHHPPGDLDVAVRLRADTDVIRVTSALIAQLSCNDVDVLDLDRAGIVARANALAGAVPLYEDEQGAYSRAAMAALGLAADTAWIRDLQLDRLRS